MFEKTFLIGRLRSFYQADPLRRKLNSVFGERTLGAEDLRSLLLIVTRNATTDSPWPVSNNPFAKYNDRTRKDCNLQIPLWQLVRASTAAPVYFPPEIVAWDKDDPAKTFFFVDGGVTPYNNPAFQLFRMATLPQYRLNWPVGETKMMLISVGTGSGGSGQPRPQRARAIGAGQRRAPSRRADGRRRDRPGYQLPRDRPLRVRRADRPGARRHDSAAGRSAHGGRHSARRRLRPPIPVCPLQSRCKPRRPRCSGAEQRSIRITSRRWIRSNTSTRCNPSDGTMPRSSWT